MSLHAHLRLIAVIMDVPRISALKFIMTDVHLFTDYSAKGIGFALTQEHPEDKTKKHLIFCGSSSLSDKQKRLPAIYGENLGIVVALEKCRFWLRGCPHFWVYIDHQSLKSIYN